MNKSKPAFRKPLLWASVAYGAFTAISVIVPLIWDRIANNENKKQQ
jgi:hypothetical protein